MNKKQIIEISERHGFINGMSIHSNPSKIKESLYAAMAECADRLGQQPEVSDSDIEEAFNSYYRDEVEDYHSDEELELWFVVWKAAIKWLQSHHPQPISEEGIEGDHGHGKCVEKICDRFATKDYNRHGHWVCDSHYKILNDEFDEEYR